MLHYRLARNTFEHARILAFFLLIYFLIFDPLSWLL